MYRAVTRSIEVTVTPRFLSERSSPENGYYFWAYTIDITNHGSETVQLKTRHWRITDAHGRLQEVRGAGVVGEEPTLEARRVVRIHQRRAAADAIRLHGRHLRHGDRRRRAFRHRNPGVLARRAARASRRSIECYGRHPWSRSSAPRGRTASTRRRRRNPASASTCGSGNATQPAVPVVRRTPDMDEDAGAGARASRRSDSRPAGRADIPARATCSPRCTCQPTCAREVMVL